MTQFRIDGKIGVVCSFLKKVMSKLLGEERNDAEKKYPCLVPYEELSEEEKTYDRNTSVETIKLTLKLGFKIAKD